MNELDCNCCLTQVKFLPIQNLTILLLISRGLNKEREVATFNIAGILQLNTVTPPTKGALYPYS